MPLFEINPQWTGTQLVDNAMHLTDDQFNIAVARWAEIEGTGVDIVPVEVGGMFGLPPIGQVAGVGLHNPEMWIDNIPQPAPLNLHQLTRDGVILKSHPTGSRYICNPPVMDTDEDYICYVDDFETARRIINGGGWEEGGSVQIDQAGDVRDNFISFRQGDVNLIITDNEEYYDDFVRCTECARDLNLLRKEDRIRLFQLGMDGW